MAFESFTVEDIATRGATIHTLRRGAGPPLLLLHGYPQTHFIWHKVADRLSEEYMDIVPTLRMYRDTSKEFATKYMWWFFLIQKAPLPEHMIGADAAFFLEQHFELQSGTSGAPTDEALQEYKRCFCTPEAIQASCEDFRAAADIDLEMDAEEVLQELVRFLAN